MIFLEIVVWMFYDALVYCRPRGFDFHQNERVDPFNKVSFQVQGEAAINISPPPLTDIDGSGGYLKSPYEGDFVVQSGSLYLLVNNRNISSIK